MTVPDIPHSRPWIADVDLKAVQDVLGSGLVAKGEKVQEFEVAVGQYLGVFPGVACSSGTAALVLGLQTLAMFPESEVIMPTYVCRSVLDAVLSVGAKPKFCDVNSNGVLTAESVQPHITRQTAAIIAVHIFGHPIDMLALNDFDIPIIEDACQSFGLQIDGHMAGSTGTIGVLSFHATKCFTTGEGGMVVSGSREMIDRARRLSDGRPVPSPRFVAPLSDLQAALGITQLARYNKFLARRQVVCSVYMRAIAGYSCAARNVRAEDFLFRFTVLAEPAFDDLREKFIRLGVHVRRGVDELLHRLCGLDDADYPNAVRLFESTVSIPLYPSLSDEEVCRVCDAMRTILK